MVHSKTLIYKKNVYFFTIFIEKIVCLKKTLYTQKLICLKKKIMVYSNTRVFKKKSWFNE